MRADLAGDAAPGEPDRPDPRAAAEEVRRTRYPGAGVVFLAGSILRGEATRWSDLDVVVLFDRVEHAWRESFQWRGWPVEAFVHDPETLEHFFVEVDARSRFMALARMVAEGLELPSATDLSRRCKQRARQLLDAGPPPLTEREVQDRRYFVADVLDDLRAPRSTEELHAAAARLHELLANCFLSLRGAWSARGKNIPRELRRADGAFAARFAAAFQALFERGDATAVALLAEEVLAPVGGLLFEGYRVEAPATWRIKTL